jgi:DNA-binding response OmpR family regulator
VKTSILLVDDEPLVREELGGFLEDEGYLVITAKDGEEGLEAFRQHHPHMVITDARMPRREGLDLARAILQENAHVPITMITGHGSESMAIAALRLGMTDFIKKPVQITDLLAALERMKGSVRQAFERTELGAVLPGKVRLISRTQRYELDNDITAIPRFVQILIDDVVAGIDSRRRDGFQLALREIILNAVEHGNLEVSYSEKTEATEMGTLDQLLRERLAVPYLAQRKVSVSATRTQDDVEVIVQDEGKGFDWRKLPDPTDPANLLLSHGRGVLLANLSVDSLRFSDKGNKVTLVIRFEPSANQEG